MRLKINKACDLNSISVLPPHSRRANACSSGPDSSSMRMSQPSLLRSQSQHSLSQGMSLSQLSQSSFDEILTNDQRLGSEDQSFKRISCLAPITSTREESLQLTRPANNVVRKWNPGSASEQRCQVSEELEHRIGLMENNLTRLGRILDSTQSDVMQVNKAVREVTLEMEGIRQKMIVQDNSLQLILKGEEDIKASLDKSLKCTTEQLKKESDQIKLQEVTSMLSALPDQIESRILGLTNEICKVIAKEIKEITTSLKPLNNNQSLRVEPSRKGFGATRFQKSQPIQIKALVSPTTHHRRNAVIPKIEKVNSKTQNPFPFIRKRQNFETKQEVISFNDQEQDFRVIIESDEEIDLGFSCLLKEKGTGCTSSLSPEVMEETMHILRKARRKRKFSNTIIVD